MLIIGAVTGLLAAMVDIGVKFVGDLRRGVCYGDTGRFWGTGCGGICTTDGSGDPGGGRAN